MSLNDLISDEQLEEINKRYDELLGSYPNKEWLIENCRNAEIMLLKKRFNKNAKTT